MPAFRRARTITGFCGSVIVNIQGISSPARQHATAKLVNAFAPVPIFRAAFGAVAPSSSLRTHAAALNMPVLRFQKPPKESSGPGGFGGFFGGFFGRGGGGGGSGGSGGDGENGGFFARLIAMYMQSITRRPVLTKATSTLVLGLAGDYCAQRIAARGKDSDFALDIRRSASVGIFSFMFLGPTLHYWYAALDRVFFGKYSVLYKLGCDQLIFAPVFNTAFIAGVGTLEGMQNVGKTVQEKVWPTLKANWMLWPAAQTVNFALVPKQWQILYVNFVGFVWNIIITYITHSPAKESTTAEFIAKEV